MNSLNTRTINPQSLTRSWPSRLQTFIAIAILVSLILAYIPQYTRISDHGTAGISSWFILWTCLFSSSQFGSHLSNHHERKPVVLIRNGSLKGIKTFIAFLGLAQAASQWLANMIYFIIFVSNRTELIKIDIDSSNYGKLPPSISSKALIITVLIHATLCLGIGLWVLISVDQMDFDNFNQGLGCLHGLTTWIISVIYMSVSIILASYQYAPQIQTTIALRDSGNISILSLALQLAATLALTVHQIWRVPGDDFQQHFEPMWRQTRHPVFNWYFEAGWASVPWFITVIGQALLLGVSVRNRHQASSM